MIDVVFPCLTAADGLSWVLSRLPEGYRPIVADNGAAVVARRLRTVGDVARVLGR